MSDKNKPARRSWLLESVRLRTGGGPHKDRRNKRQGTRAQQRARVVSEE
jgi:hypothetical protein